MGEPSWLMRNMGSKERFEDDYVYRLDCGEELRFRQGGGARDVGQTTWDGGIVLAKYVEKELESGRMDLTGKIVLELGAGTGLVGMVCAYFGAHVIATDLPGPVLDLLSGNSSLNKPVLRGSLEVMPLDWFDKEHSKEILRRHSKVIYAEDLVDPLIETLKILQGGGAEFIMSHGVHRLSPLLAFFSAIRRDGGHVISVPEKHFHPGFKAPGLYIKRLTPKGYSEDDCTAAPRAAIPQSHFYKLQSLNEKAVSGLETYQRCQWDMYDKAFMLPESTAKLDGLVALQTEKAALIERLGALERQTSEWICVAHENHVRAERAERAERKMENKVQSVYTRESERAVIESQIRTMLALR